MGSSPGQLDQGQGERQGEEAEGAMGALLPSEVSLASALWPGANANQRGGWATVSPTVRHRGGACVPGWEPQGRSPCELCITSGFEGLHLEIEEKLGK